MGAKQHDPDRERVFVRALEGSYSLKDELTRLRAMLDRAKGERPVWWRDGHPAALLCYNYAIALRSKKYFLLLLE